MVSVVVPIFNAERFIERCILSVKNQTYTEWETILVDDGSTDKTAEIITNAIRNDSRFRYVYKENGGVSSARNKGIEFAKGQYMIFLDADDELVNNCLANIVLWFEQYNVDIIQFPFAALQPNQEVRIAYKRKKIQPKVYSRQEAIKKMLQKHELKTVVCGGAYKKNLIQDLKFDEKIYLGEDCCFEFAAVVQAERILYCPVSMYIVRLEAGSITRRKVTQLDIQNVLYALNYVKKLLGDNNMIQTELNNYLFGEYMGYLNRMIVEKTINLNWIMTGNLLKEIELLVNQQELTTKKKYAYILWKHHAAIYSWILAIYYRLRLG